MNKQKLSEAERENKGEKRNSGPFSGKKRDGRQTKEPMGKEAEEGLMNPGILTLLCSRISRSGQASPD